jgi:hypothetical protein
LTGGPPSAGNAKPTPSLPLPGGGHGNNAAGAQPGFLQLPGVPWGGPAIPFPGSLPPTIPAIPRPDYVSLTLNAGWWAGVTANVTLSRTGALGLNLGAGVGKATPVSGSLTGGWYSPGLSYRPVGGPYAANVTGAFGLAAGMTADGTGVAGELGLGSPQVGVSVVENVTSLATGWSW